MAKTNTIITIGRAIWKCRTPRSDIKLLKISESSYTTKKCLEAQQRKVVSAKNLFETHDEKPTNSFLYSLVMDSYSFGYPSSSYTDMPINHKIFLAQFDAIQQDRYRKDLVFLLDVVQIMHWKNYKNVLSVFIHADHGCKNPQNRTESMI